MHVFHGFVFADGLVTFASNRINAPVPDGMDSSSEGAQAEHIDEGASVLIVGVSWLGDSIMTMPAIQAYRRLNPGTRLIMLAKPGCCDLWSMNSAVDEVLECPATISGLLHAAGIVRRQKVSMAFVLPHSFRSAVVPFLARIPQRVGFSGYQRDWMLTRVVSSQSVPGRKHQCYEYMNLMGISDGIPEMPRLTVPKEVFENMRRRPTCSDLIRRVLGDGSDVKLIGLVPGAAYGPSKRWPADFFSETARMLKNAVNCCILVFGSRLEREICDKVVQAIGSSAINLAGQTSVPELAALFSQCALVIANDSGGMHLAAAVGTPVVAIFGITDSDKTGPLGSNNCVLQDSLIRNRDLERVSESAATSLDMIRPERVFKEACKLLAID